MLKVNEGILRLVFYLRALRLLIFGLRQGRAEFHSAAGRYAHMNSSKHLFDEEGETAQHISVFTLAVLLCTQTSTEVSRLRS